MEEEVRNQEMKDLRFKKGWTYRAIGDKFQMTWQRAHAIINPDRMKEVFRSDNYRIYNKHKYHVRVGKVFKNCPKCN